jgi:hypothetical protein
MNQNILPPNPDLTRDYRMRDRLNGWTRLLPCRFLEWSSWYNQSIRNRLIGHYRLYNHFKKDFEIFHPHDLSVAQSYILQYRMNYGLKHFVSRTTSLIYSTITLRKFAPAGSYAIINRHLIYERPDILQQFLATAEINFDAALDQATQNILAPTFLNNHTGTPANTVAVQYNDNRSNAQYTDNRTNNQFVDNRISNQYNDNHTDIQFNSQVTLQSNLHEGAQGKEKGVFSKKQLLLFFDLLSENAGLERIDFQKPTKFQGISELFHAISGKSASSFKGELDDHRNKSLYKCHTPGEFDQFIRDLTNLANAFRAAGFRSIARQADKKITELEAAKKRLSPPGP